jgi:hypothetical protein
MEKLTRRETAHTKRVLRILEDAALRIQTLLEGDETPFPNTTRKALVELMAARNNAQVRILMRNAEAI